MGRDYDYLLDAALVEAVRCTDDARRPKDDAYLTRADTVLGPDDVRRAQELEASGMVRPQIAEALGCNLRDVFRALEGDEYLDRFAKEFIERDCKWDKQTEHEQDIANAMAAGVTSIPEIASSFRVSRDYVKKVAHKHGFMVRKGKTIVSKEQIRREKQEKKDRYAHKVNERNQKIIWELQNTDLGYQEIADKFGLSRHTVRRVAFENNCQRRTQTATLTPEETKAVEQFRAEWAAKLGERAGLRQTLVNHDEILALVQGTSMTYRAIADSFGCSEKTVQQIAHKNGIVRQKYGEGMKDLKPKRDSCLLLLRGTALSYRQIAKQTTLSETFVRKLAEQNGLAGLRKKVDNTERYILVDKLLRHPGVSMRTIHKQTGLSIGAVVMYNKTHGIR